jgi:translocation and assembly module TamB
MFKFIRHHLIFSLVCLVSLYGSAHWLIIESVMGQSYLKSLVSHKVEEATGYQLEVRKVSGVLPFYFSFQGAELSSPEGDLMAQSDAVSFWLSPLSLLDHEVRLSRLHVADLRLNNKLVDEPLDLSGKVRLIPRTGRVVASLRLSDGAQQTSQLIIRARYQSHRQIVNFAIHESETGPITRLAKLPPHPAITISGDVSRETADHQTHINLSFALPKGTALGTLRPALREIIGDNASGEAHLIWEEDAAQLQLEKLTLTGAHVGLTGKLTVDRGLQISSSSIVAHIDDLSLLGNTYLPIQGDLNFKGTVRGALMAPECELSLTGTNVVCGQAPVTNLTGFWKTNGGLDSGHVECSGELFDEAVAVQTDYSFDTDHALHFQNIQAQVPDGGLSGNLKLYPHSQLILGEIQGTLPDLDLLSAPLRHRLRGKATGKLLFTAQPAPDGNERSAIQGLSLDLQGAQITIDDARLQKCHIKIDLVELGANPVGTLHIQGTDVDYDRWAFRTATIQSRLEKGACPFEITTKAVSAKGPSFHAKGVWEGSQTTFEKCEGSVFGKPFRLESPLTVRAGRRGLKEISPFKLKIDNGMLSGHYRTAESGIDLLFHISDFPLEFCELVVPDLTLTGTAAGKFSLHGPSFAPTGTIALTLMNAKSTDPAFKRKQSFNGSISGTLADGQIAVRGRIDDPTHPLNLAVEVPASLTLDPFSIEIDTVEPINGHILGHCDAFSLFQLLGDTESRIEGKVALDARIGGTLDSPELYGTGSLTKGTYESVNTGSRFKNIHAELKAEGREILLQSISASDGTKENGEILGSGRIEIDRNSTLPYSFELELKHVQLLQQDHASARATGVLHVEGDLEAALLSGHLTVNEAYTEIPAHIPADIDVLNVIYINRPQITAGPAEPEGLPISLDVLFQVPGKAFLSGRGLNSEWKGTVQVKGTTKLPTLHGHLDLIKGDYVFAGRQFPVTVGSATVDGPPADTTRLDVIAEAQMDNAKIITSLTGPLRQLTVTFRSDPVQPMKEILSQVLFNKKSSEISKWQGMQLAQAAVSVGGGGTGTDLLGKIQRGIGIDRIEFQEREGETDDDNEELADQQVSFQLGKYIGRGVFIGITRGINNDENSVALEWELTRTLKIQGEVGTASNGKLKVTWKRDY